MSSVHLVSAYKALLKRLACRVSLSSLLIEGPVLWLALAHSHTHVEVKVAGTSTRVIADDERCRRPLVPRLCHRFGLLPIGSKSSARHVDQGIVHFVHHDEKRLQSDLGLILGWVLEHVMTVPDREVALLKRAFRTTSSHSLSKAICRRLIPMDRHQRTKKGLVEDAGHTFTIRVTLIGILKAIDCYHSRRGIDVQAFTSESKAARDHIAR